MKCLEHVKDHISYDEVTGTFIWIKKTGRNGKLGPKSPTIDSRGYEQIRYMGKSYLAHRLAWYFVYGHWPDKQIDHINGIKTDNRISNLRLATRSENIRNRPAYKNTLSGLKGVYWQSQLKKWQAIIIIDGRGKSLGTFKDKNDASMAYEKAAKERDGDFYYRNKEITE
jgi:hypothetical protein